MIKSTLKFVRIGPRKVRPVLTLIRKKYAVDAVGILASIPKKGARLAAKALKSAMANAEVKKMDKESLYISDVRADGGPLMKRFMSRSMGRADRILKRTTHISITLVEKRRATAVKETGKATKEKSAKPVTKKKAAASKK